MGHQLHRGIEFVLKVADLVLFSFPFVADQRHGSHPREPVKVLVLERDRVELNRKPAYAWGLKKFPKAHVVCILANFPPLIRLHLFFIQPSGFKFRGFSFLSFLTLPFCLEITLKSHSVLPGSALGSILKYTVQNRQCAVG